MDLTRIFLSKVRRLSQALTACSFEAAEAIDKLLRCAKRSVVQFLEALQQLEAHAKLGVQRFSIVANNLKSAAFQRTFGTECADEHVAARFDRMRNLANISGTLIGC